MMKRILPLLLALLLAGWGALLAAERPLPNVENSHQFFLDELKSGRASRLAEIVQIYDAYLQDNPEDLQASLERCKFIQAAWISQEDEEEEEEEESAWEQADACVAALLERFPNEPKVVLYRASLLFGDEKVVYLEGHLRAHGRSWPAKTSAELLETIAWHRYHQGERYLAAAAAHRAMRLDGERDLSVLLADHFQSVGQPEAAIATLRRFLRAPAEPWVVGRKAQLLCDLGQYPSARELFQKLEAEKKPGLDLLRYAQALEKAGAIEEARQKLTAAKSSRHLEESACRALFDLDLRHRDGATALASYEALRDHGWHTDPLLRDRLILAMKHPGGRWAARDLAGLLLVLGVGLILGGLPALWVLPMHYIGLVRRQFRTIEPARPLHWDLRHLWCISAIYLFAVTAVLVGFHHSELLAACASGFVTMEFSLGREPRSAVAFFLAMGAGTVLLIRRKHWALLSPERWTLLRTLLVAGTLLVLARMLSQMLLSWTSREGGVDLSGGASLFLGAAARAEGVGKLFLAIYREYGAGVLLVLGVIIVPLYEEMIFRGIVLDACERHITFHGANFLQAAVFAGLHDSLPLFPFFLVFGLVGGLMRRESGSLLGPVLMHAGNNFLALCKLMAERG